ncbi:hypothetical protein ACQ4PT_005541 [Festuca glaucescens]
MASQGGRGGGGDPRGRVAPPGQQSGRGNFNGDNANFGRAAGFNNFEAGSSSGATSGGAGGNGHVEQAGNFGFGQGGGSAFTGNGGGFQGNYNGYNGFNGSNGAFQGNGAGFNGAANFQGNNGGFGSGAVQGGDRFQFNAGSGFSNGDARQNRSFNGNNSFRYFRPYNGRGGGAGRFTNKRGRGNGSGFHQGRGNGYNNAAIPYVYPPAAAQQLAARANTGAQGGQQAGSTTAAAAATGAAPAVAQPVQEGTAAANFIPLEESVEETASAQGKKAKNPAKVKCHRCGIVGHFAIDCVTELCINCELPGHAEDDCPLLTAPKPHMIMYGIGEERLCFFELPCTNSYKPKMENNRLGTLAVTGGDMNIPQIVHQLQWLVLSEDFHWDVRQVGHNVYKVALPTKADLERLRVFGTFKVPDSLIEMKFDS